MAQKAPDNRKIKLPLRAVAVVLEVGLAISVLPPTVLKPGIGSCVFYGFLQENLLFW
jgi:hypothetical protein